MSTVSRVVSQCTNERGPNLSSIGYRGGNVFFCLNCCLLYACNCWSSSCFFKAVSAVSVRTTVNMFILNLNQRVGDSWCHLLLPSHLWKIILACCCLCKYQRWWCIDGDAFNANAKQKRKLVIEKYNCITQSISLTHSTLWVKNRRLIIYPHLNSAQPQCREDLYLFYRHSMAEIKAFLYV